MKKIVFLSLFILTIFPVWAKEKLEAKYIKINDLKTIVEADKITVKVPITYENVKIYNYTYYLQNKRISQTNQNIYQFNNLKEGKRYTLKVVVATSEGTFQKETTVVTKASLNPVIKMTQANEWVVGRTITIDFSKISANNELKIIEGVVLLKQGVIENKVAGNVLSEGENYRVVTKTLVLYATKPSIIKISSKNKDESREYHIQIDKIDYESPIIIPKEGTFRIMYGVRTNPLNYFEITWGKSGVGKAFCNLDDTSKLSYGPHQITCTVISLNGQKASATKEIIISA